MNSVYENIAAVGDYKSFACQIIIQNSFKLYWHHHAQYELTYIVQGSGSRIIGDSYENFTEGDLILIGPNIPHTWISNKMEKKHCKAIVIHFNEQFLQLLLAINEMNYLKKMFTKANKGLQILHTQKSKFATHFESLTTKNDVDAFIGLLQIFKTMADSKHTTLSDSTFFSLKNTTNVKRINIVFEYIHANYQQEISLIKAASLVHLSKSAFCKFFKNASGKTFSNYVNDVRISGACELLIATDFSVAQIAYKCGFESIAYFNRVFLKAKKVTPNKLRKISM